MSFDAAEVNTDLSNFTGMQERALGINGAFIGITTIVILIRSYTRLILQKSMGWDDYTMTLGAIATIGLSLNTIVCVHLGVGRYMAEIPMPWESMLKAVFCTRIFYCFGILLVKAALLLLYLRLDDRRMMRWIVYFVGANVVANSIAGVIVSIIGCVPPSLFWQVMEKPEEYAEKCLPAHSLQVFWDVCGAHVILSDIAIWVIPVPMVWNLNLPKRLKWAVSGIFALGMFSVAASCVRFYYVRMLSGASEQYYPLADSLNWCALELHVGIFCGSSSSLKTFIKYHFPDILGTSAAGSASHPKVAASEGHPLSHLSGHGGITAVTVSSSRPKKGYSVMGDSKENASDEAIFLDTTHIVMKTEVRQEATRASSLSFSSGPSS